MKLLHYITIAISLCLILQSKAVAQDNFKIFGKMKLEKGSLDGSVEVLKNGSRDRIKKVSGSGKFEFNIELNAQYVISFSQDGYVSKKISFDTKVPP